MVELSKPRPTDADGEAAKSTPVTEAEIIALENVSLRVQVKLLASDKEHLQVQMRALSSQLQLHLDRAKQVGAAPVVRRHTHTGVKMALLFLCGLVTGFLLLQALVAHCDDVEKSASECLLLFTQK